MTCFNWNGRRVANVCAETVFGAWVLHILDVKTRQHLYLVDVLDPDTEMYPVFCSMDGLIRAFLDGKPYAPTKWVEQKDVYDGEPEDLHGDALDWSGEPYMFLQHKP